MRTTVDIPDALYRALKRKASNEGQSVREIVLRSVKQELKGTSGNARKGRRRGPVIDSDSPGSLYLDNAKIYEIIPLP